MKERILTNWTFTRVLYVVIGLYVVTQSALTHQWAGVVFGGYFASMGLFAFGCAGGNCYGGNCAVETKQKTSENIQDIAFEEVKTK
jgi:hypothetical protein